MSEEEVEGRGSSEREGGRERGSQELTHDRCAWEGERELVSEWVGRGEGRRRFKSNCYWSISTSVQGGAAGVGYRKELRGTGEKVRSPWILRSPRAPQSHFAWAAFSGQWSADSNKCSEWFWACQISFHYLRENCFHNCTSKALFFFVGFLES